MAAKTRRTYAGAAVSTTIAAGINSTDLSITLAASTGWAAGPFYVVIDPGTSSEEKVYISSRSGTTLTVGTRGVDGTTAKSHSSGAVIYPVHTAIDSDEANELTAKYTTRGDIVYQGASTFERLGVGAANYVLKTNGTDPSWGQVVEANIADDAVTAAKIAAGAVGASEIANGTVGVDELATAVINKLVPVGTIAMYGGATAPTGWLLCNGDAIDAGYTALKAIVGNNTPDLKGRFAIGDNSTLTLLGTGGSATIAEANLPSHTHTFSATSGAMSANATLTHSVTDPGHVHTINGQESLSGLDYEAGILDGGAGGPAYTESTASNTTGITVANHDVSHTHSVSGTTGNGSGSGTDYYPPYLVVNYIIKHD